MLPTKAQWHEALAARHGEALQGRFAAATVAVCGLGGLGSNIAVALARAGIGRLVLIDFDRVDLSNLHRQQYNYTQIGLYKTDALAENLREIAPYTELVTHRTRITEENLTALLQGADVVCEALDHAEAKAMLVDTVLERLPKAYLVAASGMAGLGPANEIQTRRITDRFILCGDGVSDVETEQTLFSTRAMVCAAHQAHAVLQILKDSETIRKKVLSCSTTTP